MIIVFDKKIAKVNPGELASENNCIITIMFSNIQYRENDFGNSKKYKPRIKVGLQQ